MESSQEMNKALSFEENLTDLERRLLGMAEESIGESLESETPEELGLEITYPPADHKVTNAALTCAVVARGRGGAQKLVFILNGERVAEEKVQLDPGPGGTAATAQLALQQGDNTIIVTAHGQNALAQKVVKCVLVERRVHPAPIPPLSHLPGADSAQILEESTERNLLHSQVALIITLLAIVIGLSKVYGDNLNQQIQHAQAQIVDGWNRHQADRIRLDLAEDRLLRLQDSHKDPATVTESAQKVQALQAGVEISRQRARKAEAEHERLEERDGLLDLSDAALSIAMALFAITSLTQKRWLLWASGSFLVAGVLSGLSVLLKA